MLLSAAPAGQVADWSSMPTPAAVVVIDAAASAPSNVALPAGWLATSSVPTRQVESVPVLDAGQAGALTSMGPMAVFRAAPSSLWAAREAAARDWAIRTESLQWHPRSSLVGLFGLLIAGAFGRSRWTARAAALVGVGLVGLLLSTASVWLPLAMLGALPVAWFLADAAYYFTLFVWAEARIASIPVRRPVGAPTPLPIAHR